MIQRLCCLLWCLLAMHAHATLTLVAAENSYGEIAKEIGGPYVSVHSILTYNNQDPHLFTLTANTAILVTHAAIVVYNGAHYDPWMPLLLNTIPHADKKIIVIADLLTHPATDNVHFWYHPTLMLRYAQHLTTLLSTLDAAHCAYFKTKLMQFTRDDHIVMSQLETLKTQLSGMNVMIMEPFFNDMARAMQFVIRHHTIQTSLMNDVPLTMTQMQSIQDDLMHHRIQLVIFNKQMVNPTVQNLLNFAIQQQVPIVGINEMMPPHLTYAQWMLQELEHLKKALTVRYIASPEGMQ